MNTKTAKLLKKYRSLYPPEKIQGLENEYLRLWNGDPTERIHYIYCCLSSYWEPNPLWMYEKETRLDFLLQTFIDRAGLQEDFIPSLFPDDRIGVFASLFGCQVQQEDNQHCWVKPVVQTPSDVYHLRPDFNAPLIKNLFETIEYFIEQTEGVIPVNICDPQGPLSSASLIWNYEDLLLAFYDHPKEVKYLLNLITENLIIFFQKIFRVACNKVNPIHCHPDAWMPRDKGVALSDDMMAVTSPEIYEEFIMPYHQKIADALSGVFLHSCGDFSHNISQVKKINGFRGIHAGQMPLDEVLEKFCYNPDYFYIATLPQGYYQSESGFQTLESVLEKTRGRAPFLLMIESKNGFQQAQTIDPWLSHIV